MVNITGIGGQHHQNKNEVFRGKLGQYFTRREIVEFCINILSPTEKDVILDPACGSGGFLLYCLKMVNDKIKKDYEGEDDLIKRKQYDFSHYNLFGIEINDKIARVSMMDMYIHEDGHTNIEENTALGLSFKNRDIDFEKFSIILTNPPFGNTVKDGDKDKLGKNKLKNFSILNAGKAKTGASEILYLERCYDFLTFGGKIGIVLPDGILNNPGKEYRQVREWLLSHYKIIGIISLPEYAFKQSGAGIRTSILFAQKVKSPNKDDYEIFMAVAHKIGYNAVGKPEDNELPQIANAFYNNAQPPNLSVLRKNLSSLKLRLDPRHYDPIIDNKIEQIKNRNNKDNITVYKLKDILDKSTQTVKKGKTWVEKLESTSDYGIPFLEIKNITKDAIVFGEGIGAMEDRWINKAWFELEAHKFYRLEEGDIIIAITGATIGKTQIIKKEDLPMTYCGDIARIKINKSKCSPLFVESFLRSELGQIQIYKWINGATNLHLATEAIEQIYIPVPTNHSEISDLILLDRDEVTKYQKLIGTMRKKENEIFTKKLVP